MRHKVKNKRRIIKNQLKKKLKLKKRFVYKNKDQPNSLHIKRSRRRAAFMSNTSNKKRNNHNNANKNNLSATNNNNVKIKSLNDYQRNIIKEHNEAAYKRENWRSFNIYRNLPSTSHSFESFYNYNEKLIKRRSNYNKTYKGYDNKSLHSIRMHSNHNKKRIALSDTDQHYDQYKFYARENNYYQYTSKGHQIHIDLSKQHIDPSLPYHHPNNNPHIPLKPKQTSNQNQTNNNKNSNMNIHYQKTEDGNDSNSDSSYNHKNNKHNKNINKNNINNQLKPIAEEKYDDFGNDFWNNALDIAQTISIETNAPKTTHIEGQIHPMINPNAKIIQYNKIINLNQNNESKSLDDLINEILNQNKDVEFDINELNKHSDIIYKESKPD
eukprot:456889_1